MDPITLINAAVQLTQLVSRLITEGRNATTEEVETALAAVKVRQATEEADWEAPVNPPGGT